MKNKIKTNSGYVAIIALIIGVAIVAYLMIGQYKKTATTRESKQSEMNAELNSAVGSETPIDRARNTKNIIESQYYGGSQ